MKLNVYLIDIDVFKTILAKELAIIKHARIRAISEPL